MAGLGFSQLIKRNNLEILLSKIEKGEPLQVVPEYRNIYGNTVLIKPQPKLLNNLKAMVEKHKIGNTISPSDLNVAFRSDAEDDEFVYAKVYKQIKDKDVYSIKLPLVSTIVKKPEEIKDHLKDEDLGKDKFVFNTIYTGALLKTPEFGGKEKEKSLEKEIIAFNQLNELLNKATDNGKIPITIHVIDSFKKEIMLLKDVTKAIRTPGSSNKPISDFEIKDKANKTIAFISHKSGKEPTDFGQYSGVSEKGRNKIFNHPETQEFAKSIKEWLYSISKKYGNGTISQFIDASLAKSPKQTMSTNPFNDSIKDIGYGKEEIYFFPRGITIAKLIVDPKLKKMAMFGQDIFDKEGKITKEKGSNAVDFLAQGMFTLTPREDGAWDLTADKIISSDEDLTNLEKKYDPVFIARYEGNKANLGIAGCRVSIYAQEGRSIKYYVVKEQAE